MPKRIVEIVLKVTGQKDLKSLNTRLISIGKSGAIAATAIIAAASALTAFVVTASKSRKEMALLAKQAKMTVKDFEALAFATEAYGINAEQIADISKDLSDKLGEFATVGTGAFQDFADVVGLSKQQAKELAIEWQYLSGDQVIGNMVTQMEDATVSSNKMTFALESMGNDLSRLIPLYVKNGAEIKKMKTQFRGLSDELELTDKQKKDLEDVGKTFKDLGVVAGKAAEKIAGELAGGIEDMLRMMIELLPDATNAFIDFINGPQGEQTQSVAQRIEEINETLVKLKEEFVNIGGLEGSKSFFENLVLSDDDVKKNAQRAKDIIDTRFFLEQQLLELSSLDPESLFGDRTGIAKVADVKTKKDDDSEVFSLDTETQAALDLQDKLLQQEISAINRAEIEKELVRSGFRSEASAQLNMSLASDLNAITNQQDALILLYGEDNAEKLQIFQSLQDKAKAIEKAGSNERIRIAEDEAKRKTIAHLKGAASFLTGLQQINEKSKGLKRASIVANTAVAVMETLAVGGFWAIPLAAITAAIGVQQFAAVGKKDGVAGVGGSGGSRSAIDSAGLNAPSVTEQTQVNTVESSELLAIRNELANLDPDEVLPVGFTRRIIASLDGATAEGTA